jgi:hypothetical protein
MFEFEELDLDVAFIERAEIEVVASRGPREVGVCADFRAERSEKVAALPRCCEFRREPSRDVDG